MAPKSFPASLPRNESPPLRGTKQPGLGRTPLYCLAWKVNPRDIIPGKYGRSLDVLHHEFVDQWNRNIRVGGKPITTERRIPHPSVEMWLGGYEDHDVYFVAATNTLDAAAITDADIQYAKDALPSFKPRANVDIESDSVFRWYRLLQKF
uniref:EthD domain-containing protein n=1 Tax=Mycena chlorophos TaxID=658473 RepID=A0ABQ0L685_MYCCL|nr:predicted protein [Mycena chlorophos]